MTGLTVPSQRRGGGDALTMDMVRSTRMGPVRAWPHFIRNCNRQMTQTRSYIPPICATVPSVPVGACAPFSPPLCPTIGCTCRLLRLVQEVETTQGRQAVWCFIRAHVHADREQTHEGGMTRLPCKGCTESVLHLHNRGRENGRLVHEDALLYPRQRIRRSPPHHCLTFDACARSLGFRHASAEDPLVAWSCPRIISGAPLSRPPRRGSWTRGLVFHTWAARSSCRTLYNKDRPSDLGAITPAYSTPYATPHTPAQ